jgi:hypothetical protein
MGERVRVRGKKSLFKEAINYPSNSIRCPS